MRSKRARNSRRFTAPQLESLEPRQLLAADVVINEIMYHQLGDNNDHEFIELFNRGDEAANLSGWSFDAGVDFTFPDVTLDAGEYLVVAADTNSFAEIHPGVNDVVGGWTGRLANRGEGVTIVDDQGERIDRVRYADEGEWASRILGPVDNGQRGWQWLAPHDGDGVSLELINADVSNDYGHNWAASASNGGTPGAANSVASNNVAPIATDLRHSPLIPTSQDEVTISVEVIDELPDAVTATLSYRVDGTQAFTTVEMQRTGGTDTFAATIPPQADRSVIEFSVTVEDGTNTRVVPTFESDDPTRTAHRLYQVLDDAASVKGWTPESQPETYLVMTNAERIILADIGNGPVFESESNAQMNTTFLRVDGNGEDVRYNVGVRNRGGASRTAGPGEPNNYRINFTHDATFQGQTRLNLNSRFTHAQAIGSAIYRLAGMPAAEGLPVQVSLNGNNVAIGSNQFGSYVQLQVIDGQFPDEFFPNDRQGNLYRVIEFGTETGDLRFEGTDPSAYQDTYSKRTNEEEDDWTDLIDLVNVLNNTPEENFVEEVNRVVDVDQWLRFIALDALLGNLETGLNVGRGDNFWLYRGLEDTRFKLIPHDLDTILDVGRAGQPDAPILNYALTPGLQRFLTHEEFLPRYYQAFVDLINEVYNPETLFPLMDQIVGHLPEFSDLGEVELEKMKQFVIDRTAGVLQQLPDEFAIVPPTLPLVDGFYRTTFPNVALEGTADVAETQSVTVNGVAVELQPIAPHWSVAIEGEGTTENLVASGATWAYQDEGANLGNVWRSNVFDTTDWRTGPSPLGYGEGDEATVVSFGGNDFLKHITTYFRHEFDVEDVSQILDLNMRLERDDGAIVYLNNVEIARSNLPEGDVNFQTPANSWIGGGLEGQQLSFSVDPALLVDGTNVLAVEIHQLNSLDDDLSFDLTLDATVGTLTGGVPLNPGINRIQVDAFDGPDGTGELLDSQHIDIWYDGAAGLNESLCSDLSQFGSLATDLPAGTLSGDTVLAPCGPAYRVSGNVVIPEGVTLTVLPGTTVFFEADSGFTFEGGQLVAEGSEFAKIRFTRAPDVVGSWDGIQFLNSTVDNRISHAILEHSTTEAGMIGLQSSRLEIDNSTFDHADLFRIFTVNSSLTVRNSRFENIFEPGEVPTDNSSEHIKGSGILEGGQLLIEGNYFGATPGHNDSIDFDGAELPNPIPIFRNNVFAGSGDDALDLEADAYIEGNTFLNVVKDQFNTSTGDANAISAGAGRTYFVYRNTFHNVDHAVQVKDDAFLYFDHNTVDTVNISPIYFDLEDRSPGRGAAVSNSIFTNTPVTFASADQAQDVSAHNSIVTEDGISFGENNFVADPRLTDPASGDFSLAPGSPAVRLAFDQMDLGAAVPNAVWISGEPASITGRTSAELVVGGSGGNQYRYRLDGGAFSDPRDLGTAIVLDGLADGAHTLEVIGRNGAGVWQTEFEATTVTWTVDTTRTNLYINEILASNDSFPQFDETPDLIELHNDSEEPLNLSGMSISDDPSEPDKFVFPDLTIEPGGYLTLLAAGGEGPGVRLDFKLARDGEGVYLYDADGDLIDSIEYGIQITDYSIGRVGADREWTLTNPTFGEANVAASLGSPTNVLINEWLAVSDVRFDGDFLELYNTDSVPVSIAGLYITDDPIARPDRHEIAPLSFMAPNGFEVFDPNGNPENGANELSFGLSAEGEMLGLFDADLRPIDQVFMLPQTIDRSQGRTQDGASEISYPTLSTPGNPNQFFVTETETSLAWDSVWSYDQSGDDLGTDWRANGFDDSMWLVGAAPLGKKEGDLVIPINTQLETGPITHYFRSEFEVTTEALADPNTIFELRTLIDDGAVIYLNNVELQRIGMRDGEVTFETTANRGVPSPSIEDPFMIPKDLLVAGTNAIAVEVHQVSTRNDLPTSDVAFAAEILSSRTFTDDEPARAIDIQNGLRISELMYNPAGDDAAEYVELTNISDKTLDLSGVTISGGIKAELSSVQLNPGEHVVLSPDADAFRETYGDGTRVVGLYEGSLSNGGEEIILGLPTPWNGSFDAAIQRFTYSDDWYPETDGDGFSLEIVDVKGPLSAWTVASGWRASADIGGSPGSGVDGLIGDLDADGAITSADADLLSNAINAQSTDAVFDLNQDGNVDMDDQTMLVETGASSKLGDANLDGKVSFLDFLSLATNFGKQTDAVWSEGDFNGDGQLSFLDFLVLAQNFGFER